MFFGTTPGTTVLGKSAFGRSQGFIFGVILCNYGALKRKCGVALLAQVNHVCESSGSPFLDDKLVLGKFVGCFLLVPDGSRELDVRFFCARAESHETR